ncbi:hypothetical protein [Robertmurraya kyonggiensis]|uniref:Uncharacterized protein n=1 Tax=Robertmurraya kyonggiensis TaxID=1037680 RepID=A0A4U1DBN7_9BACI|nr:hypothetical protein [Robertmurraya kyonggiensis]TKC18896.1 hypothetical protein FA727_04910 [Robertmurraya kyonggiensis]
MPKKTEEAKVQSSEDINELSRMLAAVLTYLSDDDIEVIDIEYLLDHTDGLREWWEHFREQNRKQIEEEITQSLVDLSLEELERLREQINEKKSTT